MTVETRSLGGLLREHPFFEGLRDDWIELLAGCARNVRYEPGEFLYREGEQADFLFIVRSGRVRLETYSARRGPITIQTVGEGDVLGSSWLVPPYVARLDARAVDRTRALSLDGTCMRRKCDDDPRLGYELLKRSAAALVDRLSAARLQLVDLYVNPEPEHRRPPRADDD